MTHPILFLDIDGVLNSALWYEQPAAKRGPKGLRAFDPAACARLDRVLVATGARVVLSSSWRYGTPRGPSRVMTALLRLRGALSLDIIDRTPTAPEMGILATRPIDGHPESLRYETEVRGHEIQAWLDETRFAGTFAIVDDEADMAHLSGRLIRTSYVDGLCDEHVDRLISMLTP